jgi:hypothetical protein
VDIESRSDLRHRPRHAASTKAEDAIERYLLAFAAGTMPESTCSQRVQVLAEKDAGLRERRADLNAELDMTQTGPTPADLDALRPRIRNTIATGNTAAQKDLLATLVHDIQASARDDIRPVFKIPSATDQPPAQPRFGSRLDRCARQVRPAGLEPATDGLEVRCSIQLSYER